MDRTIIELADQLVNQAPLYTRDRITKSGPPPPFEIGVYGWWFEEGALPLVPTIGCIKRDRRSLLYVGYVPKRTLHMRIVGDDFWGRATCSQLRATLGLLLERQLGTTPIQISHKNWGFELAAEAHLSDWMARNAAVNWVIVRDHDTPKNLRDYLIQRYDPPLNAGNRKHPFYRSLYALRRMADLRTGTAKQPRSSADWWTDAIVWIRNQAANLAPQPADRWEVARPTDQACEAAIQAVGALGPDAPAPSALLATLSEGIELEWRHGNRLLSIEISADGTLESLKSLDGQPIEEETLSKADERMRKLMTWVGAA